MYPEGGTRAQVKKEMQLLRRLLGADADPSELLAAAQHAAKQRVVVKRPLKAPAISGSRPDYSLEGRSVRFDVYLITTTSAQQ
ncbi:class I SAM-dependent methyltransferase [Alkalilimnicola ehrlichii]